MRCGVDTFVITSGQTNPADTNILRIPCGKTSFVPLSATYFLRKVKKMDFDVINIQEESGLGVVPFLFARKARTKIATTLHTSYIQEAKALRPLVVGGHTLASPTRDEFVSKYLLTPVKFLGAYVDSMVSDRVIAICRKTMEDCRIEFRIPQSKMSLVYNGVDIDKFNLQVEGSVVRDFYKLRDRPVMLYVGRSEIRKGLLLLLWSLQGILSEVSDARLIVVGANMPTESMNAFLSHLGIQENVIFAGKVREDLLPQYYSACDLVVLPSTYEGLPLVVLEAMASGKPVVASRVGGVPEAVENGKNGILFESGDVAEMAKSIVFLLRNGSIRRRMGASGRRIAERKFDWGIIAKQYLKEFEDLC